MAKITIGNLPNEVLAQILSHLDLPAPSDSRLHDQPAAGILDSADIPFKSCSLVSQRWRAVALPFLFRNVQWDFNQPSTVSRRAAPAPPQPGEGQIEILAFLQRHGLAPYVRTVTIWVSDPDGFFVGATSLSEAGQESERWFDVDCNRLWHELFQLLDPQRITLISPPRLLAALFARKIYVGDEWCFSMPYHILSLSLTGGRVLSPNTASTSVPKTLSPPPIVSDESHSPSPPTSLSATVKRMPCDLFTIRPWTSFLLNEGSSTRVYKTYEFYLKKPPSILPAVFGAEAFPNDATLLPPTITSVSYIGIFTLSSHFNVLVQNLPTLEHLFVQLVPRNDILRDPEETRNVESSDLWMERNTSYSMLMRELFDPDAQSPWHGLRVFESGDAADQEAWRMALNYIEHSGVKGWKADGDGVLVRQADVDDQNMFPNKGNLERIQFNGVSKLPLSSMWLYVGDENDN